MQLDFATVFLQWATGGLLFLWVTTRRREVSLGYGWLLRGAYAVMALGAFFAGRALHQDELGANLRDGASLLVAVAALAVLAVSVARKGAGVSGHVAVRTRRKDRVQAMLSGGSSPATEPAGIGPEFPPELDLIAPVIGFVGLLGAASAAGGPYALSTVRLVSGGLLMGAASDAMLLGHWYLTQPGLSREPLREIVRGCVIAWPLDVVAYLIPTGIVAVFTGTIDDGYGGLFGWVWLAFAVTTLGLLVAAWAALRERSYSAVMAATGLLYLAILTAFVMDIVPRAVLSP